MGWFQKGNTTYFIFDIGSCVILFQMKPPSETESYGARRIFQVQLELFAFPCGNANNAPSYLDRGINPISEKFGLCLVGDSSNEQNDIKQIKQSRRIHIFTPKNIFR